MERNFTCVVCKARVELRRLTLVAHDKVWTVLVPVCVAEKCLERNAVMVTDHHFDHGPQNSTANMIMIEKS